jgi:hypothetical protein
MHILTAKNCAWRAIYIHSGKRGEYGPRRFSIGIDPTYGPARIFGSFGFRCDCQGGRKATWNWHILLPRSRHWWRLDGRRP